MTTYGYVELDVLKDGTPIAVLKNLDTGQLDRFNLDSIRARINKLKQHYENYDVEEEARDFILVAMTQQPAEQKTKTRTVRDRLADLILAGDLGGPGNSWKVEIIFPNRYESEDKDAAVKKIAGFVRDGLMEGSSPTWKVTVSRSVDLDKEY